MSDELGEYAMHRAGSIVRCAFCNIEAVYMDMSRCSGSCGLRGCDDCVRYHDSNKRHDGGYFCSACERLATVTSNPLLGQLENE